MKNKNGFTLIELLAVIVILAILAVITTPLVLGYIENTKKETAMVSAKEYLKAIEQNNMTVKIDKNYSIIESGNVEDINNQIKIKGDKPTSGEVIIADNNTVDIAALCIGGYRVDYIDGKVSASTKCGDDEVTILVPEGPKVICKRAEILHTNTCQISQSTPAYGCRADGYAYGSEITYGTIGIKGRLQTGNAFDCDVNGDGEYNSENERFYYLTDLNNDTAILIFYNNVSNGRPTLGASDTYHGITLIASNEEMAKKNNIGPSWFHLPSKEQWKNVSLFNPIRDIIAEDGSRKTRAGDLPTVDYSNRAARHLTYQEIVAACSNGNNVTDEGSLSSKCKFLFENTRYINLDYSDFWLETPNSNSSTGAIAIGSAYRNTSFYVYVYQGGDNGPRPAIEVPKINMEY